MAFIPIDKMKALREAAANGDERAKNIINKHFQKKDYTADLEEFFANPAKPEEPVQMPATETGPMPENVSTGNPKLDEFLKGNGIKQGDPDYNDALEDYYREFPNERPNSEQAQQATDSQPQENAQDVEEELDMTKDIAQGIINLISSCDGALLAIMQNDSIDDTTRKGAMTSLQELKQTLFDGAEKIKKIKHSLCKKEEENM